MVTLSVKQIQLHCNSFRKDRYNSIKHDEGIYMKKKVVFITGILFIAMGIINVLIKSDFITIFLYFLAGLLFFKLYYYCEK